MTCIDCGTELRASDKPEEFGVKTEEFADGRVMVISLCCDDLVLGSDDQPYDPSLLSAPNL